jgi:integrase
MASVHKDPNGRSPYYYAAFLGPNGRQFKSTRQTDLKLAQKVADRWEETALAGKKGVLTEAKVRQVLSDILELTTGEPMHFASIADFFKDWIQDKEGSKKGRTAQKYAPLSASFLASLGKRAEMNIAVIGPPDIRQWRSQIKNEGLSAASVNGAVRIISSAFEQARRLGYIQVNPCIGLDPLRDDQKGEKDVFTTDQIRALLRAANGTDWEGAILIGVNSGLRRADLTNLKWESIDSSDPETWWLRVVTQKTDKIVHVPIHADARRWLESVPRGISKAPVFPSLAGKSGSGKSGISMQFKRIMERAGIRGRNLRTGTGRGRNTSSLTLHSLRDTFISRLANAGVAEDVRMKIVAHQTKAIHRGYTHHDSELIKGAVLNISSVV